MIWRRLIIGFNLSALLVAGSAAAAPLQVNGGGTTSPNDASSVLQPASPQSLQSSGQQSTGMVAPADSGLQPTTTDQAAINSYLSGELVGGPQPVTGQAAADGSPLWPMLLAGVLLLATMAGLVIAARRSRRRGAAALVAETPSEALAAADSPIETPSDSLAESILAAEAVEAHEAPSAIDADAAKQRATGVKGAGVSKSARGKAKAKGRSKGKRTRKH